MEDGDNSTVLHSGLRAVYNLLVLKDWKKLIRKRKNVVGAAASIRAEQAAFDGCKAALNPLRQPSFIVWLGGRWAWEDLDEWSVTDLSRDLPDLPLGVDHRQIDINKFVSQICL